MESQPSYQPSMPQAPQAVIDRRIPAPPPPPATAGVRFWRTTILVLVALIALFVAFQSLSIFTASAIQALPTTTPANLQTTPTATQ